MHTIKSDRTKGGLRNLVARLLTAALFLGMSGLAQAAPLNLTLLPEPDISAAFIDVTYDATADSLTASGFALGLATGGSLQSIAGGTFDLVASVFDDGSLLGGTLSIGGTVAGLGFNSGTLLTGDLTAIGFNQANDPLEFLFSVTGGDAAGLYSAGLGGIILGNAGFGGNWTGDFSSIAAVADVGVVPVPAAVWLFGTALVGLLGIGGRRRKQNS